MGLFLIVLFTLFFTLLFGSLIIPLPLSDNGTVRYHTFPWMTGTLITVNVLVFVGWQLADIYILYGAPSDPNAIWTPQQLNALSSYVDKIWNYGLRESMLQNATGIGAFASFTSMFMHADFGHLIGNMIFLWAFGRRLEDACGPWRFLMFYLFAGMVANVGTVLLVDSPTDGPGIGASGAIFGVMGAYLLLFPGASMTCLWMVAVGFRIVVIVFMRLFGEKPESFRWTVRLPAFVVLGMYAGFNLLDTFRSANTGVLEGSTNYIAHMTGFLSAIVIFLFVRKDLLLRYFAGRSL